MYILQKLVDISTLSVIESKLTPGRPSWTRGETSNLKFVVLPPKNIYINACAPSNRVIGTSDRLD